MRTERGPSHLRNRAQDEGEKEHRTGKEKANTGAVGESFGCALDIKGFALTVAAKGEERKNETAAEQTADLSAFEVDVAEQTQRGVATGIEIFGV